MSGPQLTESGKEKMIIEAALMCAQEPLKVSDLRKLFIEPVPDKHIMGFLDTLRADWSERGLELVEVAQGWRFQSAPAVRAFLDRLNLEKPPKYSRAAISKKSAASLSIPKRYDNSKNEDGSTSLASAIRLDIRRFMQPRRPF